MKEMIKNNDARDTLEKNLERTQSLISAMEKVYAYNRIYQENVHQSYSKQFLENSSEDVDLELKRFKSIQTIYNSVKDAQDKELERIKISCGEHAIISLTTAYETYYKELAQELLHSHPSRLLQNSSYSLY